MWAEITVRCKRDLPPNLADALRARFFDQADQEKVFNATVFKNNIEMAKLVVYGQLSSSRVILVFRPESRTLKIHVETALKKESLRGLKREVEGVMSDISSFIKQQENSPKNISIVIWGTDDEIMLGSVSSWLYRMKSLLLEDALMKLIVPMVTYIVSAALELEPKKALANATIALSSLILFAIIKSLGSPKADYKEV